MKYKNHYNFSRIIKISDGCFIGILKGSIGQYELILKNIFIKSTNIGFKEIEFENKDSEIILNVIVSEENLISFKKNSNIIVFK